MTIQREQIIMPPSGKAPVHTGNIAAWLWHFLLPFKWLVVFYALFRTFWYTYFFLFPIFIGFIIDRFQDGSIYQNTDFYVWISIVYMAGFVLMCAANFFFVPEIRAQEKAARAFTLYSIKHLSRLPLEWHESNASGGKLQRVMTGRRGYQEILRHIRWDIFPLAGHVVAIAAAFIVIDMPAYYPALYLGFFISYVSAALYFGQPYLKLYDKFNEKFEALLGGVYEFISSIRTVKSFHLQSYVQEKGRDLEEQGQYAVIRAYKVNLIRWGIINVIAGLWISLFIFLGFKLVFDGNMTAGALAATIFLAHQLWMSLEVIAQIQERLYEYGNGLYRLITTLREMPKPLDIEPLSSLEKNWKQISLKNLTFTYGDDADKGHGVYDINFDVARGEKIAFVGESGAGKSTLVKLLMKQMLADQGGVYIDNNNLKHIPTGQWLGQIGFVPQDVELFNMSIRDNILIDRQDISEEIYLKTLEQAALADFIKTLPDGDNTLIGERGIKLSGGQRQRLGIARALVRQAEIIIFDEATSSLDSLSEKKIQFAMENAFADRTVFLIAHRLSTVRHVDRIIVLDQGRIIESGSFDDLIHKRDGTFARLWQLQSEAA